jgi:RNA polymerase sigma-70 factor (ECF subfamily)
MLALMLLHDARRPSRNDEAGEVVTLDEQDRTLWDQQQIAEGTAILERALRMRRAGSYQIQGAIAACHATAASSAATDWPQIVGLYEQLALVAPSPIVELNYAVALAMAQGPEMALGVVEQLAESGRLDAYYLLHATRADLLSRCGRATEGDEFLRKAIELAPTEAERRLLNRRLSAQ